MKARTVKKEKTKKKNSPKMQIGIEIFINWLFEFYDFRINELTQREEYKVKGAEKWEQIDDRTLNSITLRASLEGFSNGIINKFRTIIKSDKVPMVNEIRLYFDKNKSKSKVSIDNGEITAPTIRKMFNMLQLQDAQDKDVEMYFNIFARYMIASVNSALKIKHNDVMLMLSGPQGTFKTSYLNYLTPSDLGKKKYLLTGHIIPELTNSNTANALCERFFINIDDQMEVIFGQAYNSMKAIISADQITSRRAYAVYGSTRTRIANFVGTVNGAEFLTDSTNRRYFVIDIEGIDKNYSKIDMNKFWKEAYELSKIINPYQVYGKAVYNEIIKIADSFVEESLELILINEYFKATPKDKHVVELFMTTGEVMRELQRNQPRTLHMYRISNELKRGNFTYKSNRVSRFPYPRKGYILYCRQTDQDIFGKYINR